MEKYRKAHFISLQLIREIIVFFGSSKTSRETDRAIQTMFDIGKLKENEISQIDLSAIPEISLLYKRIEEIRRMDHESGVAETLLKLLISFILIFGVVIAITQYSLYALGIFYPSKFNVAGIGQLMIGAAIVFSASAIFICLEVFRRADLMVRVKEDDISSSGT
ncbi:MAG: hypothetical protein M1431_01080 [Candidatus Thermoplasmatota archaeon]|nr:hypothetical protein [Candidatus Thermoplasmatota archaeon]